jgi:hypothetical protein
MALLTADAVKVIMESTVRAGATRHVAAAVAVALLRASGAAMGARGAAEAVQTVEKLLQFEPKPEQKSVAVPQKKMPQPIAAKQSLNNEEAPQVLQTVLKPVAVVVPQVQTSDSKVVKETAAKVAEQTAILASIKVVKEIAAKQTLKNAEAPQVLQTVLKPVAVVVPQVLKSDITDVKELAAKVAEQFTILASRSKPKVILTKSQRVLPAKLEAEERAALEAWEWDRRGWRSRAW